MSSRRNSPSPLVTYRFAIGRAALVCTALGLVLSAAHIGFAQSEDAAAQHQAKAVFLASFSKFITWPEGVVPVNDVVIGVIGPSPVIAPLEAQAERRKSSKLRLEIRHFTSLADYRPCHIVFVSGQLTADQRQKCLKAFRGKPLLLVGESPGFAAGGGMINFVVQDKDVHFEVNNQACKQVGLAVNAKLLSLGQPIRSKP